MKKWCLCLLCVAITASGNSMSQERELEGFEMQTKRSQLQPAETVKPKEIQQASTEASESPQHVATSPKEAHKLNPRAHPKHRAGLHK